MRKIITMILVFASMNAMSQQIRSNPLLDSLKNEKDPKVLQDRLAKLQQGSENDLSLLIRYYNGNKKMVDSVVEIAATKFPQGQLGYNMYHARMYSEPNVEKKEMIFAKIKKLFPGRDFSNAHHSLAYGYANSKNLPMVRENLAKISKFSQRASSTRIVAEIVSTYDVAGAESLLAKEINELMANGIPPENPEGGPTGAQGDARPAYLAYLNLYSTILIKSGKYSEALKYTAELYKSSKIQSDELKGNYGFLLSKMGQHKEALALLSPLVSQGKASQEFKNALFESYAKLNTKQDAKKYLAEIEKGMESRTKEEVAKALLNQPAPNFELSDIDGKKVSLADFKGRIIILDFWATWCTPCIKSFPAMQMAVNKYKNDPNVKFLFIHTWERAEDPLSAAKNFLKNNNYNFDLYMDLKDPKTNLNPAISGFKATGIPVKFVIDRAGKIRFKLNGFSGGNDAAVAELSAMIELIKKEV